MRQDTSYQYAIGRIRVLENRLMKPADFRALTEESDPSKLIQALYAFGYPEVNPSDFDKYGLEASDDPYDLLRLYERIIPDFRNDQVRELMKFCPEPEILSGFLSDTDFANAKTCVKSASRGALNERTITGRGGNVPCELMYSAVARGETEKLPKELAEGIKEAEKVLAETGTPRFADFALDKAYFASLRALAKSGTFRSRRFLNRYLDALSDLKNILACVRISGMEDAAEEFSRCYIKGKLPEKHFTEAMAGGKAPWKGTVYEAVFDKAGSDNGSTDTVSLEKIADDYMLEPGRSEASDTDTIGPVFAYLLSRKREIMNIRLLLIGKRSGVKADKLKQLLRKTI